jgi:hypothetical protein
MQKPWRKRADEDKMLLHTTASGYEQNALVAQPADSIPIAIGTGTLARKLSSGQATMV